MSAACNVTQCSQTRHTKQAQLFANPAATYTVELQSEAIRPEDENWQHESAEV